MADDSFRLVQLDANNTNPVFDLETPRICIDGVLNMFQFPKFIVLAFTFVITPLAQGQLLEQMVEVAPEESQVVPLFAGSSIGLLPDKRVQVISNPETKQSISRKAVSAALGEPISASYRGVVFNSSMQSFGLLSGEIAFGLRANLEIKALRLEPGVNPRPLGPPGVYLVSVSSGTDFIRVFSALKNSRQVTWVEPAVEYIAEVIE